MTAGVNTANHRCGQKGTARPGAPVDGAPQGDAGLDGLNRSFILPTSQVGHTPPTSLLAHLLGSPQPSGARSITPKEPCL